MIIITYSETTAETIEQRIGKAEYSYYFIYKKYLPVLQKLGKLIAVSNPAEEVDKIFFANPDEECLFLSFSPPHRTLLNLRCPTVCVFAWEFSTIPDESWHNQPEYNWARTLEKIGNALTISEYAAEVVRRTLPNQINLSVIHAAVDTVPVEQLAPKPQNAVINVLATLYDSRAYNLTTDMVNDTVNGSRDPLQMQPWNDETLQLSFSESNPQWTELLIGFYSAEEWGTWSRTKKPWILLPHIVKGPIIIDLEMVAYGTNIGREIQFSLGDEHASITPDGQPQSYRLTFNPQKEADVLKIANLDLTHAPGARDHRSLGIGIKSMTMMRPEGYAKSGRNFLLAPIRRLLSFARGKSADAPTAAGNDLTLNGIVYTCVMNPQDGRKNWEDMVTAFCWAFRNEPNATLVLKMTHHNLATFLGKLLLLYSQMSPFKCRVVAVHGFLTEQQYQTLMDHTHFVVNCSHCEGQCLPLMEFMGQGIPAIAPDHTAMADYISESNAFIVKSSLYPTFWPFDERKAIRTMCYRIDWNSLKEAYEQSYQIVTNDPHAYNALRKGSIQAVRDTAGQDVVHQKMQAYLSATAEKAANSTTH